MASASFRNVTDRSKRYALADTAQQVVGGFLLAGPFVVTEEVWILATNMTWLNAAVAVAMVLGIGYVALYKAEEGRDPEKEADVAGIPIRFISLIAVSYLSVVILILLFAAQRTFDAGLYTTVKVECICAIFAMVGAATADSIF